MGDPARAALRLAFVVIAAIIGVATPMMPTVAAGERLMVFAASSLTDALREIAAPWWEMTGTEVVFSFAASSILARQIEQGARADLFFSADTAWMDYLAERGLIVAGSRRSPVANRLALIAPIDNPLRLDIAPGFALAAALGSGRLSIADPAHVPAGRYGREALIALDAWSMVEGKLALARDARAAMVFVERGEAPLGVAYASDAQASIRVRIVGLFPADSHAPIVYPLAIVAGRDRPATRALTDHLAGPLAAAVFRRHGFVVAP